MRSGARRAGPGSRRLFGGLFRLRARVPQRAERRRRTARASAIDTGRPRAPGSQASRGGFAGPGDGARKVRARGAARGPSAIGRFGADAGASARFRPGRGTSAADREAAVAILEAWDRTPAPATQAGWTVRASSRNRQRPLASRIWRGVRQSGSNSAGLPTRTQSARAREVATLNRKRL